MTYCPRSNPVLYFVVFWGFPWGCLSSSSYPHAPLLWLCWPDVCLRRMAILIVLRPNVTVKWFRSLIIERIWTLVRGPGNRNQVSVLLIFLADSHIWLAYGLLYQ